MATRGSGYGILTAAHCTTKPSTYHGDATGSTYLAPTNYDLRFTALSGGTPRNQIKIGASSFRIITQTGIVSPGITLYKYGRTTGYGYSVVDKAADCYTDSSGKTWCHTFKTKTKVTEGGDSGGPWFMNNRAYGIHHGSSPSGSLLTPIAYVGLFSGGVAVKTS